MRLPDAAWRHRNGMDALVDALGAGVGAVRLVGGCVRDGLLGLQVADIDLATRHLPEVTARLVAARGFKAIPTGLAHGTVTAVLPSGPVEITTLRHDLATDGRHAVVAFTDDWQADAARRDFTINALFADPLDGTVHDYFGGLEDLPVGTVRFIGDPLARIAEDHLRILRFFRFHARFGRGDPDAAGLESCIARRRTLMALSRERIAQEVLKLLALAAPVATVAIMVAHGILAPVLPEIGSDGVDRLARLVADERRIGGDPVRRLAALLPLDPVIAEDVARRLKLSNAMRKRMVAAAALLDDPVSAEGLAYRQGRDAAIDRLLLAGRRAEAESLAGWRSPAFALSGGDLIGRGLRAGPMVAATLRRVEDRWIEEGFPPAERVAMLADEEVARALANLPHSGSGPT